MFRVEGLRIWALSVWGLRVSVIWVQGQPETIPKSLISCKVHHLLSGIREACFTTLNPKP